MTHKDRVKKVANFLKDNAVLFSMFLSVAALGVSLYNAQQIKNGLTSNGTQAAGAEAPIKILKELPANSPVLGDPKAKLTIVEFGDFQCPYCLRFFNETLPALKTEYIDTGKAKLVYLNYAFLGEESRNAAQAALCANEQGKFWEYHDQLYKNQKGENQGNINPDNLKKFAADANLNITSFNDCIAQNRYSQTIQDELTLGKKYGVHATPSFLIGKQMINGSFPTDTFRQAINQELK